MSWTNSELTSAQLLTNVKANYSLSYTPQSAVLLSAVNKFLSIYQRLERKVYSDRYTDFTDQITMTDDGYALTDIDSLGSDQEGLKLYNSSVEPNYIIPKKSKGDSYGWYIEGGSIFMNECEVNTVVISYVTKTTKITDTSTVLPIDQDGEAAAEMFVAGCLFERNGEEYLETKYKEEAMDELNRYFRKPNRCITL